MTSYTLALAAVIAVKFSMFSMSVILGVKIKHQMDRGLARFDLQPRFVPTSVCLGWRYERRERAVYAYPLPFLRVRITRRPEWLQALGGHK